MDFILKKIVSTFIMPLPIGMILIIIGLLYLYRQNLQKAKFLFLLSFIWLFLFSYSPFSNLLLHTIESTYPTLHHAPQDTKYIYVLGAGHTTDDSQPITSQVNPIAVIRLNEGIRLYNKLQGKAKLIVSGYSGIYDPNTHAAMQQQLAVSLGVPKNDLILNTTPKDTQEEALEAKRLCGNAKLILVTSASHMKRAMKFFEQVGLHPTPAPTNHLASIQYFKYTDIFSSDALVQSRIAMHEFIGLLWQKIKGI